MPGHRHIPEAARSLALALTVALALGVADSRDRSALAQDEPALNCSACTLRHKDLQIRRHAPGICPIKGTIGEAGERIYLLPDGSGYDQIYIDLTKGERWFCTEADAQAAGWKAAQE